jgi:CcmD family protein
MLNQVFFSIAAQEKPVVTGDVGSGLVYLIAACVVVWLFIFGYIYSLNRRQERLRREIELMKQEEAERQQPETRQAWSDASKARQMGG